METEQTRFATAAKEHVTDPSHVLSFPLSSPLALRHHPAEEYRRSREQRFDDPMANLGGDELLPM